MLINLNSTNFYNKITNISFEGKEKTKVALENVTRRAYNWVDYDSIDIKKVKSLIKKGCSLRQIGEAIGQNMNTVRNILKRFGLKTKESNIISNINEAELRRLLDSGLSQKEIAKNFGLKNSSALTPLIKKLGFNTPTQAKLEAIPYSELKSFIEEGCTYEDLAKFYNIAPQYITKRCRELGLKTHGEIVREKTISKDAIEFAMKFHSTKNEIAKVLQISLPKLNKLMKEYGIKTIYETERDKEPTITIEQLKEQVSKYRSKKEICENLKLQAYQLNTLLKRYGLDINPNLPPSENELRNAISSLASQVTHKKECYPQKATKRLFESAYIVNALCGKFNLTPRKMEKLIKQYDLEGYINENAKQLRFRL